MSTQQLESTRPTVAEVSMQDMAQRLVEQSISNEPAITRIYQFPSDDEVRLLEVDITVAPVREGEAIAPFYFARDPKSGLNHRSAIALIAPEDVSQASLPPDWGSWEDAQVIWEQGE